MVPGLARAVHSVPFGGDVTATLLDVFGVLILAYNVLRGLTTGLIRTAIGLVAVVMASDAAWQYPGAAAWIDPWLPPTVPVAFLLRPLVVWLGTFLVINLVGFALRWAVRVTPLVAADRIGGALFGLFTGLAILATPMLLIANFPLLQQIPFIQELLRRSAIAALLNPLVQLVLHLAPTLNPNQTL